MENKASTWRRHLSSFSWGEGASAYFCLPPPASTHNIDTIECLQEDVMPYKEPVSLLLWVSQEYLT